MAHDYEDFTRLKSQVQQLQAEAKQHLEQLEQQRKELEATIPADELAWYESVKDAWYPGGDAQCRSCLQWLPHYCSANHL